MTNAKYSPRNYIIVKRGSIAQVLLTYAKGSLYQFFSTESYPEVYVQTHDPSIKSLRRLQSKTGLFLVFGKLYQSSHDRLMAIF